MLILTPLLLMTYLLLVPGTHISYGLTDKLLVLLNIGQYAKAIQLLQMILTAMFLSTGAYFVFKKYPYRWSLLLASWGMGVSWPFLLAIIAIDKFFISFLWLPFYVGILYGVGVLRSKGKYLGIGAASAVVIVSILSSWQLTVKLDAVYKINMDQLTWLPKEAAVICLNDKTYYTLKYLQQYQGIRTDVLLVSNNNVLNLPIFNYDNFPERIADEAAYLIQTKRVFFSDADAGFWRYLGVEGKPFYVLPYGIWWELITYRPKTENISLPLDYWGLSKLPTKYKWYKEIYDRYLISLKAAAEIMAGLGKVNTAGLVNTQTFDKDIFNGGYQPAAEREYNAAVWVELAQQFKNMGDENAECVSWRAANRINRYRMDVHSALADCYMRVGDEKMYEDEKEIIDKLVNFK